MNEMDPKLVINQDDYDEPEETREFNFNQESNQFDQSLPNVDTKIHNTYNVFESRDLVVNESRTTFGYNHDSHINPIEMARSQLCNSNMSNFNKEIVQNSMVLRTDQNFFRKSNHDGDESPIHKTKLGYGVLNQHHRKGLLSQQFKIIENKSQI